MSGIFIQSVSQVFEQTVTITPGTIIAITSGAPARLGVEFQNNTGGTVYLRTCQTGATAPTTATSANAIQIANGGFLSLSYGKNILLYVDGTTAGSLIVREVMA